LPTVGSCGRGTRARLDGVARRRARPAPRPHAAGGRGGELDLVDQHGAKFALSRLAGEPVLLFFGFTHCGSTCPIALADARQVLHTLGPAAPASVVFVTLDP
jgi:protein SCO1/2